jgi:hypothetical protein
MSGPARTHDEIEDQMRNRKRKAANDYDDDGQLIEKVGFGEAGGYDEVNLLLLTKIPKF